MLSDNSFTDIPIIQDQQIKKVQSIPKLPRITTLRKGRTASIRSEEQLYHMQSGKRQSFTGYAFSSEESSFESFRKSVYKPIQVHSSKHRRSNTMTVLDEENNRESFLSTLSRSRTLPNTLFRRVSPSPSRSPSPNRSISDRSQRSGDNGRLRSEGEEVELSIMSPSSPHHK
jgi:hypothetical protein